MPLSAHSQRQQLQEEESIFAGVLNPRQSAQWIVENTEANFEAENGDGGIGIQIDQAAVEMVAEMICRSSLDELKRLDFAECEVHPKTADRAAIDWIFFMDSINFSFWSEEDKDHKWQVTHRGKTHSGYFAACATVNLAMEIEEQQGIAPPLTSAQRMAQMTMEELERIFRGDNDTQIPMLTERLEVIRENGSILLGKFGGSFWNVLPLVHNAGYLLRLVVGHFPNFRDFAEYKGKKVSFLKRAQILVADVENCLRTAADGGGDNSSAKMVDFSDLRSSLLFHIGIGIDEDQLALSKLIDTN